MKENYSDEDKFRINTLGFAELIESYNQFCWDNGYQIMPPQFLTVGRNYIEKMDKTQLINNFIVHTHEYWDAIRERDVNFLLKSGNVMFHDVPLGNINPFEIIFTAKDKKGNPLISEDERESIWDYFSSLVKIAIKYIHRKRECEYRQTADGLTLRYTKKFMTHIKVRKHATNWDINLLE